MSWDSLTRGRCALAAAIVVALATAPAGLATDGGDVPGSSRSTTNGMGGLPDGGPPVLYTAPPVAPQLTNSGVWRAQPLLVSGATAYRDGEFLYQDYLYDDQGAQSATYPAGPQYGGNAADLVEVRTKLLPRSVAVRLTLNTLKDPAVTATTIALGGTDEVTHEMPDGAATRSPGQVFVTVHGTTGLVTRAADGQPLGRAQVTVDRTRRQVEVRVPYTLYDPRPARTMLLAAGAGLWDAGRAQYRRPGPTGSAFYNAAFRRQETGAWMSEAQAQALTAADLTPFTVSVDLTALRTRTTDERGLPRTGQLVRVLASAFEPAQGRGSPSTCNARCGSASQVPTACSTKCVPQYAGRLQPYSLYVPPRRPASGYGFTLNLHGCGNPYTVFNSSVQPATYGARGGGTLVATPEARGDCYWYEGIAQADVFEVWADVARHYLLNPRRTAIAGASMGGYGAQKIASLYPSLFGAVSAVAPCAGPGTQYVPGEEPPGGRGDALHGLVPSLRHVPVMSWLSGNDNFCTYQGPYGSRAVYEQMAQAGYRYETRTFYGPEHLGLIVLSFVNVAPLAAHLAEHNAPPHPRRVTYVVAPEHGDEALGLKPDSAYWVSKVRLRKGVDRGQVDAVSHALTGSEPAPLGVGPEPGVLLFAAAPVPYVREAGAWSATRERQRSDALTLRLRGVRELTVDRLAAGLTCRARLDVVADGPVRVRLSHCPAGAV